MTHGILDNQARPTALLMLLGLVVANFVLQPLTEPDFGWHLRAGLDLLQHGLELPSLDPYSHTMPDWAWVEHAWLTDVLIGVVYTYGGGLGIILFFGGVTAAAWALAARLADCGWTPRLIACCLSLWVVLPYLGARTQLISLLGLSLLLSLLWRWSETSRVWGIPLLFLAWANLHGGFAAGLFLLGLVIAVTWLEGRIRHRRTFPGSRAEVTPGSTVRLGRLALLAAVAASITLLNPYGWRLHVEIIESLSDRFMLETLHEWQSPSLDTVAGRSYLLYLGGLGLAMLAWYRRIEPVRWAVWGVFLILSLRHMRNIPLFLLVSLPLCAELLAEGVGRFVRLIGPDAAMVRTWLLAGTVASGLFVSWLGPEHLRHVLQSGLQPAQYFQETSYPIEAVEWIRSHRERVGRRLYNDYAYGGFLLWWLPEEKIFIDGRMPAWRMGERRIFEDYVVLTASAPPALSVLDKYAVDWALVRRNSALDVALEAEPAWVRVYEDEKVSIYSLAAS